MIKLTFNKILYNLIEDHDLTQKRLASEINIAPSTISNYVQGTREPDFETLKLFAKYFGVTTDYLLDFRSGPEKSHGESEMLQIYRSLHPDQKTVFKEQGRAFIRCNAKEKAKSS